MPKPLSMDLRTRILADYQAGASFADLGRHYRVTAECVRQFLRRYEATGEIAPRPTTNRRVPLHRRRGDDLRSAMAANPSHTLESLRDHLGLDCDLSTIWDALQALKISFKKRRSSPPSRRPARTSRPPGPSSASSKPSASTRPGSSSSTRLG
jgi:transposase